MVTIKNPSGGLRPDAYDCSTTGRGKEFMLQVALEFKPPFAGLKLISTAVADTRNENTGWKGIGWWTVPLAAAAKRRAMRNHYVDYLRGFAILLVLTLHFFNLPSSLPGVNLVTIASRNGYYGVSIFFVVSGYLITSRVLVHFGSLGGVSFRTFYAMRAGRIVPCLVATLAILTALGKFGPPAFHDPNEWRMAWYALTFRFNLYGSRYGVSVLAWDVLWSLSIEEAFYIIFPVVCRIFSGRRALMVFFCLWLLMGRFTDITIRLRIAYTHISAALTSFRSDVQQPLSRAVIRSSAGRDGRYSR